MPVVLLVAADLRRIALMDGNLDRTPMTGGASVYPFCWNLLLAARWTLLLSLMAFVGGGLVAAPVAMARISERAGLRNAARAYIALIQGTPLLVQLFLAFFGLALLGFNVPPLAAAALRSGRAAG